MGFFDVLTKPRTISTPRETMLPRHTDTNSRYGQSALDSELSTLAATGEGGRNDQLNRTMFALSQLVASGHIEADTAWQAVADTARHIGLGESEIQATMKSAYRAGTAQPRQVDEWDTPTTHVFSPHNQPAQIVDSERGSVSRSPSPTSLGAGTEQSSSDEETLEERVTRTYPLVNFREIWDQPLENEWLLEPLIPAGRLVVIYSPPKLGKSLITLEAAAHLAEGTEWLGYTPPHPVRVLYIDYENDPRADVVERLKAMRYTPERLDNLLYLPFPAMRGLDTVQGANQLFDIIDVYQPQLVILDTLSRAIEGDENENDTYLNFYRHTELYLKKNKIALLRLDHSGKDTSKGQRGGSAKSGDVDVVWKLSGDEQLLRLECESARMNINEKILNLRRLSNPLRHEVISSLNAWRSKLDEINAQLDEMGADNQITNKDAREMLRGDARNYRNSDIAAALKERKIRPYGWQPALAREEQPHEH